MQSIIDTLTSTVAATHAEDLRAAFAADPQRFSRFSASLDDLLMDYSKCAVNDEVLDQLEQLLVAAGVAEKRDQMFSGAPINFTEAVPCCIPRCATAPTARSSSMAATSCLT